MEVVIGVILLIGAFALGHTTADQEAEETRARLERERVVESLEDSLVPQGCRYRVNGPVQRDLTVPYSRHGSNDGAERRRYAELWAQAMWEDAERILAFQRAYVEAGRRLYPGVPMIDPSRLPRNDDQVAGLQREDRVLFFTRPDCASCDALLARLLARIERIAGVDIYLTGIHPGNDQAVRDWAAKHGIDPDRVRARKVTLNFEAGALAELTDGQGKVPYLMRRRGEDLAMLSIISTPPTTALSSSGWTSSAARGSSTWAWMP